MMRYDAMLPCFPGYCIYILEREASPELFNLATSQFLSLQCVATGWASDTYDVYDPVTWPGKMVCITATLSGLILTSFIIGEWELAHRSTGMDVHVRGQFV